MTMKEQTPNYHIFWEKTTDQNARILRIFSDLPIAEIPAQIADHTVTELGNYCFAPDCRIPDKHLTVDTYTPRTAVTALCGNYLESVQLPNSLKKIGNYAFYNCRNLSAITFSGRFLTIGSDAFMNCHKLHQLFFACAPMEKTCLRQLLAQISWDVEVSFLRKDHLHPLQKEAVIYYPEYYETYDEIAPAHIFGRKISGEGFRARQCFHNDMIDFPQYDKIFKKASVEESPQTLCWLAFDRLRYPHQLSESDKSQYAAYILAHGETLCQQLVHDKRLDDLLFLLQELLLSPQNIQYVLTLAAQNNWSEGSAGILHWKQLHSRPHSHIKYEFDTF